MALQTTGTVCQDCGAPVLQKGEAQCGGCAGDSSEDTSDKPTVIGPTVGYFDAQITEESMTESQVPTLRPRAPSVDEDRQTGELHVPEPAASRMLAVTLVVLLMAGFAGAIVVLLT